MCNGSKTRIVAACFAAAAIASSGCDDRTSPDVDASADAAIDMRATSDAGPDLSLDGASDVAPDRSLDAGNQSDAEPAKDSAADDSLDGGQNVDGRVADAAHEDSATNPDAVHDDGAGADVSNDENADGPHPDATAPDAQGDGGSVRRASFAAGYQTACVIQVDGTVRCQDTLDVSRTGLVSNVAHAVDVAMEDGRHACAAESDGAVWCWDFRGQPPFLSHRVAVDPLVQVSVGVDRACAIGTDHAVRCWAHPDPPNAPEVIETIAVPPARQVAAGLHSACAVTLDDELWCWGEFLLPPIVDAGLPWDAATDDPDAYIHVAHHPPIRMSFLQGVSRVFSAHLTRVAISQICAWGVQTDEAYCWPGPPLGSPPPFRVAALEFAMSDESNNFPHTRLMAIDPTGKLNLMPDPTPHCFPDGDGGCLDGLTELAAGTNAVCVRAGDAEVKCLLAGP